jgi:translation initiation factor 2B subunit (eIF-2B alpha/beta/delta family)
MDRSSADSDITTSDGATCPASPWHPAAWIGASRHRWERLRRTVRQRWKRISPNSSVSNEKLQAALAALPARKRDIDQAIQSAGQRFTTITDTLLALTKTSGELVNDGERLLLLASGKNEGEAVLKAAIHLLQNPLQYLASCASIHEKLIERLEHCDRQIKDILSLQSELQTTIAPLTYVQILFKIESATLTPDLQEMFIGVSRDIRRLEEDVARMFAEKFLHLGEMHQAILVVLSQLRAAQPTYRRLGYEKKNQIAETLEKLERELVENSSKNFSLSTTTRALSAEVQKVVLGLQFHDIVTQKAQHLTKSIDESIALSASLQSDTRETALAALQQSTALQQGHLHAIENDLDEAYTQIETGIKNTLEHAASLDTSCVALRDLNTVTVAPDGMIQILLETISETRTIIGDTHRDALEAHRKLEPIEASAKSLTTSMTELSVSMHLIALNAQIQAVRLGTDTGLETLAACTVDASVQTTNFSLASGNKLADLAASLSAVIGEFDQLRTIGEEQSSNLQQHGKETETNLHALRDRSINSLVAIGDHAQAVKDHSDRVLTCCHEARQIQAGLATTRAHFEALSKQLAEQASTEAHTENKPSDWKHRYTMASEREVHAAVLAGRAPVAVSQIAHADANLELFDAPIADTSAHDTTSTDFASPETAAIDTSPPPAPDADPVETPKASAPKAEKNLGDNVDLF